MTTEEQQNPKRLFTEFTSDGANATAAPWEQQARKELRDTPLENLTWRSYENIAIKPYYTSADLQQVPFSSLKPGDFPFLRGRKTGDNSWLNIQQITVQDESPFAIDQAADALRRGADGVHFVLKDHSPFDVPYLLRTLDMSKHSISFTLAENPHQFLERLYAHLHQQHLSPRNLHGFVNYDPLTATGKLSDGALLDEGSLKAITKILDLTKDSPDLYGITVNGTSFSSIGASAVQEVAYTLSAAVTYLDHLTTAGEPLESVLRNVQFCMASGTNYFFEIVKLRVVRLLWTAVVEAYAAEPALAAHLRIHASSSSWYQTTLDPYTNMLRVTTEAMAAVLSGCDSLTVSPFDSTFSLSDEFSERIARNVSVILKEEAYLDKVVDPAAGSYYLEALTQELATKAWELFKEVEAKGGFEKAYQEGFILGSITEVSRRKFSSIASGKDVLVGTNKYPNPQEKIDFDPEELIQSAAFDTTRAAYPTEVMRMATELHLRKRKRRPKVIIAEIGQAREQHVNTTFARELFKCAGFDTELQQFENAEDVPERMLHAAAEVVVVSATEAVFHKEFVPKLRAHQSRPTIIMAADPQHMQEELVDAGFDAFLFEDCDTITILELIHRRLQEEEDYNGNGA
ncbi:methylmalonyl-CoA mutase family protein [Botryobacter ruber]|uniref:methylmalonyl-CoA mutase family protein n=1 Tax=Botryobacter ruber TaxID=2171629 RepID=UPI000E0A895B|nr:methylmalonyl-CoA mutase family protein [Botryobacter ruber]